MYLDHVRFHSCRPYIRASTDALIKPGIPGRQVRLETGKFVDEYAKTSASGNRQIRRRVYMLRQVRLETGKFVDEYIC